MTTIIWINVTASPLHLEQYGLIITYGDITERKQAEALLAAHQRKYRDLFEANQDGISLFRIHPDGTPAPFLDVNEAAAAMVGYSKAELAGMTVMDVEQAVSPECIAQRLATLAATGQTRFETVLIAKDQRRIPVEVLVRSIDYKGGPALMNIVRDISERKQAEAALRASLAEKEALLREVHHRVKNNLAAIIGLFDLQRQSMSDPQALTVLAELSGRIRSMSLVHEKLYRSDSLASIDFQEYLHSLISHLRTSFGTARIRCDIAAQGVCMPLDLAVPCGMIINELVTNALKYAFPKNGSHPEDDDCRIHIALSRQDDTFTLSVADNGVGLPADFDWINAKTMGLLWCGCSASINWAAATRWTGGREPVSPSPLPFAHGTMLMDKAHILIVEDDGILACCLQEMVIRMGYAAAGPLACGEEAVAYIADNRVDLVLMDIELAGSMNGIQRAEAISQARDIPIVFLTGYSHDPLLEQAKIASPYGYLIKPVPERELAATLAMALHRHELDRELRQSQQALAESELQYRTLADSGQVLIWTSGPDKLCNYFNQPWLRFTGRTLEQELGLGWTQSIHPEDFDRCVDTYVTAFDRRELFSMSYRLRNAAGEYRWLQDDGTPRFDSAGQFLGYIGHCLDISELKQAEAALRTSEQQYRRIVDTALEGIWGMDGNMRTTFVNPHLAMMLGYTPQEMLGRCIDDFIYPDELPDHFLQVQQRQQGKNSRYERRLRHKNGDPVWTRVSASAVQDSDGRFAGSFCMFTDITERKRAEEQHKRLQAQLQQAQKMEAIGTLAGGIAHDFNNILGQCSVTPKWPGTTPSRDQLWPEISTRCWRRATGSVPGQADPRFQPPECRRTYCLLTPPEPSRR
jgi:PAS domain S-box-containing protein